MRFQLDTARAPRRAGQDRSIVPMINVVFLLLIFFLMTASLTPPAPLDIDAPVADAPQADSHPDTLYIDASGSLAFNGARDAAALEAIAAMRPVPLSVLADAALPAADLAAILPQLGAIGVAEISLRTILP